MITEAFSSSRPLNIKDITLPEPGHSQVLPFDAENVFTDEEWDDISSEATNAYVVKRDWQLFLPLIFATHLINPSKSNDILKHIGKGLTMDDNTVDDSVWLHLKSINSSHYRSLFDLGDIGYLKTAFPHVFEREGVSSEIFSLLERELSSWVFDNYNDALVSLFITFPEENKSFSAPTVNRVCQNLVDRSAIGRNPSFIHFLAALRIIAPERFKDLNLNENEWEEAKEGLEMMRMAERIRRLESIPQPFSTRKDSTTFVYKAAIMVADLKIIAAKDVLITDKGLELIMPEPKFVIPSSPLPEKRKF